MNNKIKLIGTVAIGYALDHVVGSRRFYTATIRCSRKSGVIDFIPIMVPEDMIVSDGRISVIGELRTYNTFQRHLKMYVYVEELSPATEADFNCCMIDGSLCSIQKPHITVSGHMICKAVIAVNRPYGKSSYIPCAAWNEKAECLASFKIGERVRVSGRLQSRLYIKEEEHHTCYELSLNRIEEVPHER